MIHFLLILAFVASDFFVYSWSSMSIMCLIAAVVCSKVIDNGCWNEVGDEDWKNMEQNEGR